MTKWETESFDDLSAVWLEAEHEGWLLCVQYDGSYGRYSAWVTSPDDEQQAKCSASYPAEGKEIAEAMYEQMVIDAYGGLLGL